MRRSGPFQGSSAGFAGPSAGRGARAVGLCVLALGACTQPTFSTPAQDGDVDVDESEGADAGETRAGSRSARDADTRATEADATVRNAPVDGAAPRPGSAITSPGDRPDSGTTSHVEASVAADASVDAASPAPYPDWAEPLFGRYFKRSVTFAYDDSLGRPINTRNVEHSLMTIEKVDGAIDVRIQLCDASSTWVSTASPPVYKLLLPAALPAMRGRLELHGPGEFSSTTMEQELGFDSSRGCSGTGRSEKRPGQGWITGATCVCSMTPVPIVADDCRVVDTDNDGKAGIGLLGEVPPWPAAVAQMVLGHSVTFKDGAVDANRMHSLREERTQGVACLNVAVTDTCSIGNNTLCPGGSTKLIPARADATCAELDMSAFGVPDERPLRVDCRAQQR